MKLMVNSKIRQSSRRELKKIASLYAQQVTTRFCDYVLEYHCMLRELIAMDKNFLPKGDSYDETSNERASN